MLIDSSGSGKTLKTSALSTPAVGFKFASAVKVKITSNNATLLSKVLPTPRDAKLSRSQLLFSITTSVDPRSLIITKPDEFFLYMDMRAEEKWSSFGMTSQKWALATQRYNGRLKKLDPENENNLVKKSTRALMDTISGVERQVLNRLAARNFICEWFVI